MVGLPVRCPVLRDEDRRLVFGDYSDWY